MTRGQNASEELEKSSIHLMRISNIGNYDYILINKNLDVCFKQIENIILSNKKKQLIFFINFGYFIISFRCYFRQSLNSILIPSIFLICFSFKIFLNFFFIIFLLLEKNIWVIFL